MTSFGAAWLVVILLATPAFAQQAGPVAGLIEHIDCIARLMKKGSTTPIPLHAQTDDLRPLFAGERVHCESGNSMKIYTARTGDKTLTPHDAPYEILAPGPGVVGRADTAAEADQKVIAAYSGIAGARPKSILRVIYSPADGAGVKPRDFTIKWNPFQEMRLVNLTLRDRGGNVLWRQENIPASSKSLAPEQARNVLMKYRAGGNNGDLILQLASQDMPFEVRFSLLSVKEEEVLDAELGQWNGSPGGEAFLHLRRAYTFGRFRMFSDEADEYDAALRASPRSTTLLKAALSANVRAGNRVRADEIQKLLPAGSR
jgi:hypothetical protein